MRTQQLQQRQAVQDIVVQANDCRITTEPNCRLIARGIDSSIALAMHAPKLGVAALLRVSRPTSRAAEEELALDTAIPMLMEYLREAGVQNKDLSLYAVGAADIPGADPLGGSGKTNELALRRLLWREGLILKGEDLGGNVRRSLWFDSGTGRVIISTKAYNPTSSAAPQVHESTQHQSAEGDTLCRFAS